MEETISNSPKDEMRNTGDVQNVTMKIERVREAYRSYTEIREKPRKGEIWVWYLYGLCSYFVLTALIPIVFPLIISQIVELQPHGVDHKYNYKGFACKANQTHLYERLTRRSISINTLNFSPLEWTSISWVTGLILASPLLSFISTHLDSGRSQQLIAAAATAIGSLFCLPVGFFKTTWIFPLYIAFIVAAHIVGCASHTRHLGVMLHGFTGPTLTRIQFPIRRGVSSWFSSYATCAGCLGSAVISAFTYHMLRQPDMSKFISLWIVSIFAGLKWLVGIFHVAAVPPGPAIPVAKSGLCEIFKYPHAIGTLIVIFLSSFTSMCVFTGGVLYILGQLCIRPLFILYTWLIYFIFPSFSMPLLQPLQHVFNADAVKMKSLGFLLSLLTSGMGFYFNNTKWETRHILLFAAIQSTSTALLHAFGRVLLLDSSPHGKEGAFSVCFSWIKALGTCAGFAVASAIPANVTTAFGVAFSSSLIGILILIFGNISDVGGAMAAGLLHEDSERGSPVPGIDHDTALIVNQQMHHQTSS